MCASRSNLLLAAAPAALTVAFLALVSAARPDAAAADGTWSQLPANVPTEYPCAAVATSSQRLVVAGYYGGLWTLDLSNPAASWVEVDGPPPAEAMVWDPLRERMLVFGGIGDTLRAWSLTLGPPPTWTLLSTWGAVPLGEQWRAVHDPIGDRVVFLSFKAVSSGGPPTFHNSIYVLPLSGTFPLRWEQWPIPSEFTRRASASFSYDASRRVGWIFGGESFTPPWNVVLLNDVWRVDLTGGPPYMTPISTTGTPPSPRSGHAAYFDAQRDRLVVFGGPGSGHYPINDCWQLDPGDGNLWAPLTPAGGPPPPRYHMAFAADPARDQFLVYGGHGYNGTSYVLGDVWALSFAVVGVEPLTVGEGLQLAVPGGNPVHGDLGVSFVLPGAGSGMLELVDVTGRVVRAIRLDAGSTGVQTVALARRGEIRPGVYFVRLRQGSEERRLRVAVLTSRG